MSVSRVLSSVSSVQCSHCSSVGDHPSEWLLLGGIQDQMLRCTFMQVLYFEKKILEKQRDRAVGKVLALHAAIVGSSPGILSTDAAKGPSLEELKGSTSM